MDRKQEIFEKVLKHEYIHDDFVGFTREFLNDIQLVAPYKYNKEYSNFSFYVDGYYHIGNYVTVDGDTIVILSVNLNKGETVERARSMQRNFVKTLMERNGCVGAIVAFFTSEEPEKWRLSFIRMDYEFSKGKVDLKLTPAKRYSYLVGDKEPCTTALQRLFPIFSNDNEKPGLDDIEDAFSVEKVTKEFFDKYVEKYHDLKEYLETNDDFMIEARTRGFSVEQFAKKLLGQIVFLYFIQKKGWLGVNAIPTSLTQKQYNSAFYAKGVKSREIIPRVYKKVSEDKYRIDVDVLRSLSDEDENILAGCVKGDPWGTGPKDFMRQIFKGCKSAGKNFFDDYLEPLFYTGLNLNRGENGFYAPLHRRIPFLNGGLFEQLDNYDWENNDFNIPNEIFSNIEEKGRNADGILDIFDRYNFTMNEDEPMEREVAIDPEMLGKVFENLLDVTDRKSKGAFYTPREIVHYMCQETLINYLVEKTGISDSAIRDYILYGEFFKDEDTEKTKKVYDSNGKYHYVLDKEKDMYISEEILSFKHNVNRLEEIDNLLKDVKVADLAVGSGAFPLGMLNEIVKARDILTSYLSMGMNNFQKKSYIAYGRKHYDLKVNTIKNCIFACDIDPSAVDIAKLRLWLSIVIDDEITKGSTNGEFDEHTKPRQLPNLDCNIICGNSLIDEFRGNKLVTQTEALKNDMDNYQENLFNWMGGVDSLINKLIELQDRLFFVKNHNEKEDIKAQINDIYNQIVLEQIGNDPDLVKDYYDAIKKDSLPFILWQIYFPKIFRDNGGFDIVIGNPPYVGEKGNKELFRPIAATAFGKKYYYGKMDLFYFFFHKAIDLGNSNAEIAFITTNYYTTAFGGKKMRMDFKKRTQIRRLINLNELKVFESAQGQHNLITMLTKISRKKKDIISNNCLCKISGLADSNLLKNVLYTSKSATDYFDVYKVTQDDLYDGGEEYIRISGCGNAEENSIESILEKVASSEKKLCEIADIKQGIVSGADKYTDAHERKYGLGFEKGKGIFVLHKDELEALNIPDEEINNYVKSVYKNSQVSKYHIDYDDKLKVFYMTKEVKELDAPQIITYLEQFKPILAAKRETVEGKIPWYSLHWPRNKEIFEASEKIVNSRRSKSNTFALETRQYYEQSDLMITVIKKNFELQFPSKYVLALLNSKLYYVWLKNRGKLKGDMLEIYGKPLEEIPIKQPTKEQAFNIIQLVNTIIETDDLSYMENIDEEIYKIFELTDKEINIVEEVNNGRY